MIGIVLVTHGRLAAEFRAALEHVVGPQWPSVRMMSSCASTINSDVDDLMDRFDTVLGSVGCRRRK